MGKPAAEIHPVHSAASGLARSLHQSKTCTPSASLRPQQNLMHAIGRACERKMQAITSYIFPQRRLRVLAPVSGEKDTARKDSRVAGRPVSYRTL